MNIEQAQAHIAATLCGIGEQVAGERETLLATGVVSLTVAARAIAQAGHGEIDERRAAFLLVAGKAFDAAALQVPGFRPWEIGCKAKCVKAYTSVHSGLPLDSYGVVDQLYDVEMVDITLGGEIALTLRGLGLVSGSRFVRVA